MLLSDGSVQGFGGLLRTRRGCKQEETRLSWTARNQIYICQFGRNVSGWLLSGVRIDQDGKRMQYTKVIGMDDLLYCGFASSQQIWSSARTQSIQRYVSLFVSCDQNTAFALPRLSMNSIR